MSRELKTARYSMNAKARRTWTFSGVMTKAWSRIDVAFVRNQQTTRQSLLSRLQPQAAMPMVKRLIG